MKNITKIYGFHAIESVILNNPKKIQNIFIDKNRRDKRTKKIIELAQKNKVKFTFKDAGFFKDKKYQGIVAEYETPQILNEKDLDEILKKEDVFLLILDGIQDPHNLGAILRTANAVGVDAVITPKDKAVGITPVVYKISSGAVENIPFIQVTNLSQAIKKIKKENVWCIGLAGEVEKNIYETDLKGRIAIIVGSEGKGLRRLTRENCDDLVKIPMEGSVESLNVSVATGVALFEVLRQQLVQN